MVKKRGTCEGSSFAFMIVRSLVRTSDNHAAFRWLTSNHVHTRSLLNSEWHASYCGLSLLLDSCLSLGSTVPVAQEESTILNLLLELLVVLALVDVSITIVLSLLEDVLLDVLKQLLYILSYSVDRACLLLKSVAAHLLDGAVLQVASTQNQTYRNRR